MSPNSTLLLCVVVVLGASFVQSGETNGDWYKEVANPLAKKLGWNGVFKSTGLVVKSSYNFCNKLILLDKSLNEDDLDASIEFSIAHLNKEKKTLIFPLRGQIRESIQRLEDLLHKRELCDLDGFSVLQLNDRALNRMAHRQPTRRLEKIVHRYMVNHAKLCGPQYYLDFEEREHEVPIQTRQRVERFSDAIILAITGERDIHEVLAFQRQQLLLDKLSFPKLNSFKDIGLVFRAFDSLVPERDRLKQFMRPVDDELHGGKRMDKDKFANVFDWFLANPCKLYVETLGPILLPALWDTETLGQRLDGGVHDSDLRYRLNKSLMQFKVCASIVATPNHIMDQLLRYAAGL